MTAIITNKYRIHCAEIFKTAFSDTGTNLYLFIGRSKAWTTDTQPPTPVDTVQSEYQIWDEMLSLKKIIESDVTHAIARRDWVTNTKFIPYDDTDGDLFNHPTSAETLAAQTGGYTAGSFYTITDAYSVYKCLDNNGGGLSTVKPTGTATAPVKTGDGYVWQYMYTIGVGDVLKFVTSDWIPVKTLLADDGSSQWAVQAAAVDGSIDIIKVTNGGAGYVNYVAGPGDVVSATSTSVVLGAQAGTTDNMYTNSTITITAGTGQGQRRKITGYVGSTKTATVISAWSITPDATSKFKILPTITISGNGTNATAEPTIAGGVVTAVTVLTAGSGYKFSTATVDGGGASSVASVAPVLSPQGGHGADPVSELGANFVIANVKLQYNEGSGDFPVTNDYRRVGIIKGVQNFDTTIATASTRIATPILTLTSVTGAFVADEVVTSASGQQASAFCVEYATNSLKFFQDSTTGYSTFGNGEVVTGAISGATGTISAVVNPEVKKNTGQILYVEQRRPIMRSIDQLEDLKLIVEF